MSLIINNQAERLEYNNIKIQRFPLTHIYKVPSLHIYVNIEGLTFNEQCLMYREYIVEPFDIMLDDYYDHLEAQYLFQPKHIIITFSNKLLTIDEYITLVEMFNDLLTTIGDVKITYQKTILNIHE